MRKARCPSPAGSITISGNDSQIFTRRLRRASDAESWFDVRVMALELDQSSYCWERGRPRPHIAQSTLGVLRKIVRAFALDADEGVRAPSKIVFQAFEIELRQSFTSRFLITTLIPSFGLKDIAG